VPRRAVDQDRFRMFVFPSFLLFPAHAFVKENSFTKISISIVSISKILVPYSKFLLICISCFQLHYQSVISFFTNFVVFSKKQMGKLCFRIDLSTFEKVCQNFKIVKQKPLIAMLERWSPKEKNLTWIGAIVCLCRSSPRDVTCNVIADLQNFHRCDFK
jgi:hypothetical protein